MWAEPAWLLGWMLRWGGAGIGGYGVEGVLVFGVGEMLDVNVTFAFVCLVFCGGDRSEFESEEACCTHRLVSSVNSAFAFVFHS